MMLEGKIVAILSKTEVLIDIGLKHGVKDEMVFAIKNPETIEVKDVDVFKNQRLYYRQRGL